MIASVNPIRSSAWPPGWEDVEVVDSEIVDEAGRVCGGTSASDGPWDGGRAPVPPAAGCYERSGRIATEGRFGRLVSVLA